MCIYTRFFLSVGRSGHGDGGRGGRWCAERLEARLILTCRGQVEETRRNNSEIRYPRLADTVTCLTCLRIGERVWKRLSDMDLRRI